MDDAVRLAMFALAVATGVVAAGWILDKSANVPVLQDARRGFGAV